MCLEEMPPTSEDSSALPGQVDECRSAIAAMPANNAVFEAPSRSPALVRHLPRHPLSSLSPDIPNWSSLITYLKTANIKPTLLPQADRAQSLKAGHLAHTAPNSFVRFSVPCAAAW